MKEKGEKKEGRNEGIKGRRMDFLEKARGPETEEMSGRNDGR